VVQSREPLVITRDRIVIDGYARLELARRQGRMTLPCIEYELTEQEALHRLLQRLRQSNGPNAFSRILLALDLEPLLTDKARSNQQAGGQNKGSSKLAEAERLDVRKEIVYIDPVECIDCGACVPVCPVSAIFALDDLPEKWKHYEELNASYVKDGKFTPDEYVKHHVAK